MWKDVHMQTVLWGGPLDGCELIVPDPPSYEMTVPVLTNYPPDHADVDECPLIKHHYVFDSAMHRYNYAGDWP